jgi:hypothetical protein
MRKKLLVGILVLFLAIVFFGSPRADDEYDYPIMRFDPETWTRLMIEYETAPRAQIDPMIRVQLYMAQAFNYGTSMDLLGHIDYDPNQRHQGSCGNCWAWASTGLMEIAHDVQDGVFDRLSVQFINSCRDPGNGCCGNNIGTFAAWYSAQGFCIPWDNANASFADGGNCCRDAFDNPCPPATACGDISTTPNYPIVSIAEQRIPTTSYWDGVDQATAIQNIKNVLNQDKAIYFGFALPDDDAWTDFKDYWKCLGGETEATSCDLIDDYCGDNWNKDEGGGHAVVILGYNDDVADPYWIALNSWGTFGGARPNGLFRIPIDMDYSCLYPRPGDTSIAAFVFHILDVEFGNAVPVADAGGPYDTECAGTITTVLLDGTGSYDLEDDPLSYSWTTDCSGASFNDPTSPTPILTVDSSNGCSITCSVILTVSDAEGEDTATAAVTISDTVAPDIICPLDITVECTGDCGIQASDPQLVPFFTGVSATDGCDLSPVIVNDALTFFNIGTTIVTFTATDYCGNSSSCTAAVTVVDTIPPEMEVTLDRYELWPPNHKLVEINATVTVTDVCDPDASFVLTSITSNEPDDGLGDGDAENDIQGADFGTPDTTFMLRAERSGTGEGRTYTILYTAFDACDTNPNNTTTVTVYVHVPKSRRK